jgi:hypothetical protein
MARGSLNEFEKLFNLNVEMLRGSNMIMLAGADISEENNVPKGVKVEEVRTLSSNNLCLEFG